VTMIWACHHLKKDPMSICVHWVFFKCCRAIRSASADCSYPSCGSIFQKSFSVNFRISPIYLVIVRRTAVRLYVKIFVPLNLCLFEPKNLLVISKPSFTISLSTLSINLLFFRLIFLFSNRLWHKLPE